MKPLRGNEPIETGDLYRPAPGLSADGETAWPPALLAGRERLLAIHGIGPETADSMLLYAGGHHSFVIDAYTKRIFQRHGWSRSSENQRGRAKEPAYDELKTICESALNQKPARERLDYWQDFHAQLVFVGHHYCRSRQPRCDLCPLQPLLPRTKSW